MQDEKSQLQNRERAMRVLRARLYERGVGQQRAPIARPSRQAQVGTGERAEKIRTYNYPEKQGQGPPDQPARPQPRRDADR